jgi:ribosomal protein S18 acetylase RimI-like enzyme
MESETIAPPTKNRIIMNYNLFAIVLIASKCCIWVGDMNEKNTATRTPSTRITGFGIVDSRDGYSNNNNNNNNIANMEQSQRTANHKTNSQSHRPRHVVASVNHQTKRGLSGKYTSFHWKYLDTHYDDCYDHQLYTNNDAAIVQVAGDAGDNDDNNIHIENEKPFLIRPLTMKDMASVLELGNSIFTETEYPNLYRTWDELAVVENYAQSAEFCFVAIRKCQRLKLGSDEFKDEDINHSEINYIESHDYHDDYDEKIVGFLLGSSITKSSIGTRGFVQWLAVESSYRRMGIATFLLKKFREVAEAGKVSRLLAHAPADNTPAIRLFEKAGLWYKKDQVYLTKQLQEVTTDHCDDVGYFDFSYNAKGNRFHIRRTVMNDLHPIHVMGEKIFTSKNCNLFHFWDEQLVLSFYMLNEEYCVTATVNDDNGEETVVAFAFGTILETPLSSYGLLEWLGCHPDYQRMGLATQLYNVMVELFALKKVNVLMIDTQSDNTAALRFFRKIGFGSDEEHVYLSSTPMTEASINLEIAAIAAQE